MRKAILKYLSAGFCACMIACACVQASPSSEQHLSLVRLNDIPMDAYVRIPSGGVKVPLLLLMQGSGCDSLVDPFLQLTEAYGDRFARLVVEKVGVHRGDDGKNCSSDYLKHNSVSLRVFDYLQVLAHLRSASWWNGDLYVMGASEGGLVAGIVAAYARETKRVAILMYGGGVTMAEARPDAIVAEDIKAGKSRAEAESHRSAALRTYDEMRADPSAARVYDGDSNTYLWWNSILDLRLTNVLVDISAPILIAQGERDEEMPVRSSREAVQVLKDKGKRNFIYCEYPGLSHEFKTADGKSKLTGVFLDSIDWLVDAPSASRRVAVTCKGASG